MIFMEIPITQSKEWQKLQDELGEKSFLVDEEKFHYLAIVKNLPYGHYLYLPYGPNYVKKSDFKLALNSLKNLAEQRNAIFIRIEPRDPSFTDYQPNSAKKSTDLNPKETWILALLGTEDELKSRLPSRLLRYHKSAAKKGITIEISHNPEDIHYLFDLQKALADKKGINTFSEDYLKTELKQPFASLYLVKYDQTVEESQTESEQALRSQEHPSSEVIAAGLVFDYDKTRYNLQGAQSDLGRKLHATGILTIQLILDAKKKGLELFDFWGIAPEGAPDTHPWAGFTNFKKTFAGYERDYAGTYDIVLKPFKYKIYQLTRKINRLLRRGK